VLKACVGLFCSSGNISYQKLTNRIEDRMARPDTTPQNRINIDLIAVAIALTVAALIRFNIIPPISF